MKTKGQIALVILVFFFSNALSSELDSLKKLLGESKGREKVTVLSELCQKYIYTNSDSAIRYGNLGVDLTKKNGQNIPLAHFLNNLGLAYFENGDYTKALGNHIEAEKIFESENNSDGKFLTIMNIGRVYQQQELFDKALNQYSSALLVAQEIGNKSYEAQVLGIFGSFYYATQNKPKALDYFSKALKINQEINNVPLIMEGLNNVAVINQELGKYNEALSNFRIFLNYAKKMDIKGDLIAAYHNIALVYKDKKKYIDATSYLDTSVTLAKDVKDFNKLQEVYSTLSEIYKEQNNVGKAFEYFQLSAVAKDSLISQTRDKQFIEMSTKYDTEKKEAENKLLKSEGETQRAVTIGIAIGLALVGLLAYFIFRNYKTQQRANVRLEQQNTEIKEQKHIIEDKQKEILDSIAYAKKLQEAILPPDSLLKKHFEHIFLYYQPKDIVAGDFYWMETVKLDKEHVLIAAADSTGHGVPGAMVSVVCSNALHRAVNEFKIKEPGEILDRARDLVLETFSKSERDVKDGMDISLLSIQRKRDSETTTIKWAGANNPIYIISNDQLREVKANKFPVGAYIGDDKPNFTTQAIEVKKGDRLYLFSDGIEDQFGGPKGKKYKAKRFQQKLLESCHMPMEQQKEYLRTDLLAWQGSLEQVDDILVMGIEV